MQYHAANYDALDYIFLFPAVQSLIWIGLDMDMA